MGAEQNAINPKPQTGTAKNDGHSDAAELPPTGTETNTTVSSTHGGYADDMRTDRAFFISLSHKAPLSPNSSFPGFLSPDVVYNRRDVGDVLMQCGEWQCFQGIGLIVCRVMKHQRSVSLFGG